MLALFDLDGTLTDPKIGITRAVQFGLRRVGVDVEDLDTLTPYIGPPLQDGFVELAGLSLEEAAVALAGYREYYGDVGLFENVPYDGIMEMLGQLKAAGWQLAVATSKPTIFAERILEHFEMRAFFDQVAGASLDGTRRHKHDVIRHSLDLLGCGPSMTAGLAAAQACRERCVMVGDRQHDVFGAHRVGIPVIGVTWGYGSAAELKAAGADLLVDRVDDVPPALSEFAA
jgi:phosphoglycolate phosphatase